MSNVSDCGNYFLKGKSQSSRFRHQNILQSTQKRNLSPRKTFSRKPRRIGGIKVNGTQMEWPSDSSKPSSLVPDCDRQLSVIYCGPFTAAHGTYRKSFKRTFMIVNANSKKAYLKIIIQFIHPSSGESRK